MKGIRGLFALLMLTVLLSGAFGAMAEESELNLRALAVYDALAAGDYAQIAAQFDDNMARLIDEAALSMSMEGMEAQMGAMTGATVAKTDEDGRVVVLLVEHEGGQTLLQMQFDSEWAISGLYIQPLSQTTQPQALARALPEGAQAREVTLFAGSERELGGELIVPAGADGMTAYVVFAHGSGPSDMDETVGANKPFRDLAYDLAVLGVGSLRFDKITYAAPEWPIATVEQEYLEPVREALSVLRQETGAQRVFLIGHSEGGMLTPWLVAECGFDGGIALAGTPRQLWEISYAQNLALLDELPEEQREAVVAQIETEAARALTLADMSDEEAENTTVFGMSAVYLRHMARMDQAKIAQDSGKPFLFLWGTADVQVDRAAFEAWSERLGEGPFSYRTYEGLNHLFIPAQEGESILNVMEAYAVASQVDAQVALDIADWIAVQ